MLALQVDLKD